MTFSTAALTVQFLAWIEAHPRTYAETMEAWRTSCPRLSIWEDAIRENLVQIERAPQQSMKLAGVVLTPEGRAFVRRHDATAHGLENPIAARTAQPITEPASAR